MGVKRRARAARAGRAAAAPAATAPVPRGLAARARTCQAWPADPTRPLDGPTPGLSTKQVNFNAYVPRLYLLVDYFQSFTVFGRALLVVAKYLN